ncbi:uncharacterized protein J5F26_005279 [Ciconia maguari]
MMRSQRLTMYSLSESSSQKQIGRKRQDAYKIVCASYNSCACQRGLPGGNAEETFLMVESVQKDTSSSTVPVHFVRVMWARAYPLDTLEKVPKQNPIDSDYLSSNCCSPSPLLDVCSHTKATPLSAPVQQFVELQFLKDVKRERTDKTATKNLDVVLVCFRIILP